MVQSDVVKEAKAAATKAAEESVSSGGGGTSLMDELDLQMDSNGGADSSALANELEKVQNRMAGLVSKADNMKETKALKSMLTKEMASTNEKIDEVLVCQHAYCES